MMAQPHHADAGGSKQNGNGVIGTEAIPEMPPPEIVGK